MRLKRLILTVAVAGTLILSACDANSSNAKDQADGGTPTSGGAIRVGIPQAWGPLDSLELAGGISGRVVANNIYDTLLDVDADGEFIPELATAWKVSSDGLTYVFDLRGGVLFQDGTPFNADAVKAYWDRMMDPKLQCRCLSLIEPVSSVKATGEYQITFKLSTPVASFLALQVDTPGMIPSPTAVKRLGPKFTRAPVGAGPFAFVSQVTDDTLVLKRFDKYWKKNRPYLDRVTFKNFSDADGLLTAVQTSDVDIAVELPYSQVHTAKTASGVKVINMGELGVLRVSLNSERAPFKDLRARQAINYATDAEAISKAVNFGLAPTITHPFGAFYSKLEPKDYPKYDLAKAKDLVKQLGGSIDFQLTTSVTSKAWAQAAQAMWKEAGINAEIKLMDPNSQIAGLVSGNFQAGTSGYSGAWDPDLVAFDMFHSGANRNYPRMSDPEVDELLVQGRETTDAAKREQIYVQIANRLAIDLPYVWMYGMTKNAVTTPRVHGVPLNGDGMLRLTSVWATK